MSALIALYGRSESCMQRVNQRVNDVLLYDVPSILHVLSKKIASKWRQRHSKISMLKYIQQTEINVRCYVSRFNGREFCAQFRSLAPSLTEKQA